MSSSKDFVEYVVEQIDHVWIVKYRKMFGEFAIYCDEKVVALVCDNKLFVKYTEWWKKYIWNIKLSPAYPWARLSFLIDDKIEDSEWVSELIKITTEELPDNIKTIKC